MRTKGGRGVERKRLWISGSSRNSTGTTSAAARTDAAVALDTVKNLFGRFGNSLIGTGLIDRLEQVG